MRSHFHRVNYFFFFFHFLGKGSFEISGAAQSFSHVALSSGVILLLPPSRRKIADSTKNQKTRIKGSYYWNVLLEKSWLIIWLNYSFPDSAKQLSVRASCYIPLLHTQICLPMPTYYIKKSSWQRENYFYFTTSGRIKGHRRFCNSLHPKNFHAL